MCRRAYAKDDKRGANLANAPVAENTAGWVEAGCASRPPIAVPITRPTPFEPAGKEQRAQCTEKRSGTAVSLSCPKVRGAPGGACGQESPLPKLDQIRYDYNSSN